MIQKIIATFVTPKDKIVTMARPISAETANKVTLHVNGGYRYASTRPRVTNEATGKNTNKSIHWGTVTEDLRFIPNQRYIYASPEERDKLVFPEDWDLSEVRELSSNRGPGRPPSGEEDSMVRRGFWSRLPTGPASVRILKRSSTVTRIRLTTS